MAASSQTRRAQRPQSNSDIVIDATFETEKRKYTPEQNGKINSLLGIFKGYAPEAIIDALENAQWELALASQELTDMDPEMTQWNPIKGKKEKKKPAAQNNVPNATNIKRPIQNRERFNNRQRDQAPRQQKNEAPVGKGKEKAVEEAAPAPASKSWADMMREAKGTPKTAPAVVAPVVIEEVPATVVVVEEEKPVQPVVESPPPVVPEPEVVIVTQPEPVPVVVEIVQKPKPKLQQDVPVTMKFNTAVDPQQANKIRFGFTPPKPVEKPVEKPVVVEQPKPIAEQKPAPVVEQPKPVERPAEQPKPVPQPLPPALAQFTQQPYQQQPHVYQRPDAAAPQKPHIYGVPPSSPPTHYQDPHQTFGLGPDHPATDYPAGPEYFAPQQRQQAPMPYYAHYPYDYNMMYMNAYYDNAYPGMYPPQEAYQHPAAQQPNWSPQPPQFARPQFNASKDNRQQPAMHQQASAAAAMPGQAYPPLQHSYAAPAQGAWNYQPATQQGPAKPMW